jgi:hypothetical protein
MENQEVTFTNLVNFLSSKPEINQILQQIDLENENEGNDFIYVEVLVCLKPFSIKQDSSGAISKLKNSLYLLTD